ncbi:hypothetical protein [Nocardioides jensenii]|uniref:hypothetical protein n=1 Tax=Nocardioides jensenii TaxID=1843 RepID=UPI00082E9250|nr:hypothetical protein [Nocardioides jensenii]
MSGEERVHPELLRGKAGDFETEVAAPLNRATQILQGPPKDVAFANFSWMGYLLGAAYVEALNYTFADLDTKTTLLSEFRTRLESTAQTWETAEDASTVETGE